ncbi:unnamed protein product [Brassica oleracea var. botrytis]
MLGFRHRIRSSSWRKIVWIRSLFHSPVSSWMRSLTTSSAVSLVAGPIGLRGFSRLSQESSQIFIDAPSPTTHRSRARR